MFPLVKEGGVKPFDAVDAVKVGIGGNDTGDPEALHDGGVDEVTGVCARIPFDHLSRENDVIRVDGFNAALHHLSESSQNLSAYWPTTRCGVVVDQFLQYLRIGNEGLRILRDQVQYSPGRVFVSMVATDCIDR